MNCRSEHKFDEIGPFEWLTDFSNLSKLLDPSSLFDNQQINEEEDKEKKYRVLHIGSGSSSLGEHLIRYYREYSLVINADCDENTLLGMKMRWNDLVHTWKSNGEIITSTCLWTKLDFNHIEFFSSGDYKGEYDDYVRHCDENFDDQFKLKNNYFDLVLDKGTLDCALCSDNATSGLIMNTYQSLKVNGGVYFVVSFHHKDLMMTMLKNCPGVEWDVEHHVVPRKGDSPTFLESINDTFQLPIQNSDGIDAYPQRPISAKDFANFQTPWSSSIDGTFQPSEEYNKYVNVYICRRKHNPDNNCNNSQRVDILDREKIRTHIHECNDLHFKQNNPMVTQSRKKQIQISFLEEIKLCQEQQEDNEKNLKGSILPLRSCYEILFTAEEKEHFTFEYFMEDYEAFVEEHVSICDKDGMNYDTAILFLETMQ